MIGFESAAARFMTSACTFFGIIHYANGISGTTVAVFPK
ncbi:hypothetical protein BAOM_4217 [Peribacillus asahii]|uniref:Uncharacterized protein n=1 Tax=Peribacillus asahii TaxID=228899 RepID=A0A3Q9RQL1_9BACI|nr:hypothetical protein BAOM_4217 [Peribacillus asahii]